MNFAGNQMTKFCEL